jgi:hypothetical protein
MQSPLSDAERVLMRCARDICDLEVFHDESRSLTRHVLRRQHCPHCLTIFEGYKASTHMCRLVLIEGRVHGGEGKVRSEKAS